MACSRYSYTAFSSSSVGKMCNCLFPYFPLCTDTTELCLYYLLLPCFGMDLGILLSRFPSLVTSISPDFGLLVGRSPPVLLLQPGQMSHGAGPEGGMGRADMGGFTQASDIQDGHLLPVSRFPFCSSPSEGNSCFSDAKPSSPAVSHMGHNDSVAHQREILPPSTFLGCLAESTRSSSPSPSLKQHVLSFHTSPRTARNIDLDWWVKKGDMTRCSLKSVKAPQYPWAEHWVFPPPGVLCGLSSLSSSSNPRRSFALLGPNQL